MKKIAATLVCFFVFGVFSSGALAEFYRYTDQNGAVRYTDDLSQVPANQRPKVDTYTEVEDSLTPEERATNQAAREQAIRNQAPKPSQKKTAQPEDAASGMQDSRAEKEYQEAKARLEVQKKTLDEEYQALSAEIAEVETLRKSVQRSSPGRALNSRIQELNDRIGAYQQKRLAYEKELNEVEEKRAAEGTP
ncbi:MAG: DUF4124 domain-containing protein [Thermodesulfobacteriota bacterium]